MVLTPRIAGTNLVPNGGGRYATAAAVPGAEYSIVNELNQTNALIYEGDSEFQYDQFGAKQNYRRKENQNQYARQQNFDHFGRLFEQTLERPINKSMLGNTSESFAAAFETSGAYVQKRGGESFPYQPLYALDIIIDTYETNAKVIYGEIPPVGEKLNVVL
ncbi:MAG: hypothetical protein VX693_08355 [Pseudomonadota bacterium]|nr:hypothetical protein [Pseudomonadota bacterium]